MTQYPEHDRLRAVRAESQAIGNFIGWLNENAMQICKLHEGPDFPMDGEYLPHRASIQALLAEYFEIDLRKLEAEKEAMLDELRAATAA